jgi:hypothetical protein
MLSRLEESEPRAVDQRRDVRDVRQPLGFEQRRARLGPVAVALDGVDLAVVREQAEGLRQGPARHGVGREALVEHADRRAQALVGEVAVKARQVHGHDQALVGDHARRQAADIELRVFAVAISALRRATNSAVDRPPA